MTTLEQIKREGRLNGQLYVTGAVAEERAQTLAMLDKAGVERDEATHIVDLALENEELAGYSPDSDERLNRAHAALVTVQELYTGHYVPVGEHNTPSGWDVSLAQVTVEREVQIRVKGVDPERVRLYADAMREGDPFPPLLLFWERERPALWLADGFHRYDAARSIGTIFTFPALIYAGTRGDAAEYAATCNATHGLPMSSADKQAAIRRLLQMHADLSDREIARRVGCSHPTVGTIRKVLEAGGKVYHLDTVKGADGKEYPRARQEPSDYASVWQIENCLRNYLDVMYGRRGRGDPFQAGERIHALEEMRSDVPAGLNLPDRHRKRDLVQAINNVQEQVRQMSREQQEPDAEPEPEGHVTYTDGGPSADGDGGGGEPATTPWLQRLVSDEIGPEPWQRLEKLLIKGDWRGLRVQLALCEAKHLARALQNIDRLNGDMALGTPMLHVAARCLVDAILQPGNGPTPEPTDEAEPATTFACPECSGDLEDFIDTATGRRAGQYCSECGTVLEAEAA